MAVKRAVSGPIGEQIDGRTKYAKRFAAVVGELTAEFDEGDADNLSTQLRIRSAAVLIVKLEQMQTDAAAGEAFDPAALSALSALTAEAIRQAAPYKGLKLSL